MLLNLCFHMAMTSAVFAGGITLTNYRMVCQAVSRRGGGQPRGKHLKLGDAQEDKGGSCTARRTREKEKGGEGEREKERTGGRRERERETEKGREERERRENQDEAHALHGPTLL